MLMFLDWLIEISLQAVDTFTFNTVVIYGIYFPTFSGKSLTRNRSASIIQEEETELLGHQQHVRTIMEDIDRGALRKVRVSPAVFNRSKGSKVV